MFGSGHWDEVFIVGVDVTGVRRLESGQLDKKPRGVDKTGVWIRVELTVTGGIVKVFCKLNEILLVGVDPGKIKFDVDVTGV